MKYVLQIIFIGCMCSMKLGAQDTLKVSLAIEPESCQLGSASLSISGGTAPYSILWSSGHMGNLTEQAINGTYTVHVSDADGKDTIVNYDIQKKECEVGISNHFTPNGDGYNDTWGISNINAYPDFELIVFNRWGQQVHHQEGTYEPWNGTQYGFKLPDATYYYVFYYNKSDKSRIQKGDVSILR